MIHRVALDELYRDSPTAVRCRWAFRDFIEAHVVLDAASETRALREEEEKTRSRGVRG
jgi:hypothetical protein